MWSAADGIGIQRRDLVSIYSLCTSRDIILPHGLLHLSAADDSLFGATVTSWKQGGKERLFLSSKSSLDSSKPVSSDGIAEVITTSGKGGLG
jgi:D-hexose-6-phosphate mutarotase